MDFITPGETDYDKLFNNYWCPLLGCFPSTGIMTSGDQITRSIEIIRNARTQWGINPFHRYKPTDQRIESTDEEPKELHQYPQWKLDSAQTIACTYPQVKQNINAEEYNWDLTLDSDSVETVNIVRKLVEPHLNDQIKDHHILAILAIEEAWDVLNKVLIGNEKEDSSDIMNQVQVAGNLLAEANRMSLEEEVDTLKPKAEFAEKHLLKGNVFHRNGDNWDIVYDSMPTSLRSTKGLICIAHLLVNTGQSIRADDLRMWVDKKISTGGRDAVKYGQVNEDADTEENEKVTSKQDNVAIKLDGVDVVLDEEARNEYKKALVDLNKKLQKAKENNDLAQIDKIQGNIDFIKKQKIADLGLKDSPRKFNTKEEADRKDIDTNIRRAYEKLREKHKPLWLHLTDNIKISYLCSYSPENHIDWDVKF